MMLSFVKVSSSIPEPYCSFILMIFCVSHAVRPEEDTTPDEADQIIQAGMSPRTY